MQIAHLVGACLSRHLGHKARGGSEESGSHFDDFGRIVGERKRKVKWFCFVSPLVLAHGESRPSRAHLEHRTRARGDTEWKSEVAYYPS